MSVTAESSSDHFKALDRAWKNESDVDFAEFLKSRPENSITLDLRRELEAFHRHYQQRAGQWDPTRVVLQPYSTNHAGDGESTRLPRPLEKETVNKDASLPVEIRIDDADRTEPMMEIRSTDGTPLLTDYVILRPLGAGGMGVVYKARQCSLHRFVAVKTLYGGDVNSADAVTRMATEAEAAAALDHPGIVPVFEFNRDASPPYIVMGYVNGPSLDEYMGQTPLPAEQACDLTRKVAEAVEYAHGRGVVHRDVKPSNVLINENGEPRITDFGLAKHHTDRGSSVTQSGQVLGTPGYMPPEQARGDLPKIGPLSDVYSIGATLYYMLTGRPPFKAASTLDTLNQVLDRTPVPPKDLNPAIPEDLNTICLKCLQKHPERRYQSARELAEDLTRFQNKQPILARPVGLMERTAMWCRRNPTIAVQTSLLAFLSLVLVIGGILFFSLRQIAEQNEALAAKNEEIAEERRRHAVAADYRALIHDAQRAMGSHKPGWRERALDKLRAASALDTSAKDLAELRTQAVRSITGFDLEFGSIPIENYASRAIAFDPQSKFYAVAGLKAWAWGLCPGTVLIRDGETGKPIRKLQYGCDLKWVTRKGKQDGGYSVAVSGDSRWVAVGTRSGWIHCWDLQSERPIPTGSWRARTDDRGIERLEMSGDGRFVFSNAAPDTVVKWNAKSGQVAAEFKTKAKARVDFCDYHAGTNHVVCRLHDQVLLVDGDDFRVSKRIDLNVASASFSENGKWLAATTEAAVVVIGVEGNSAATSRYAIDNVYEYDLDFVKFCCDDQLLVGGSFAEGNQSLVVWEAAGGGLIVSDIIGKTSFTACDVNGRSLVAIADKNAMSFQLAGGVGFRAECLSALELTAFDFAGETMVWSDSSRVGRSDSDWKFESKGHGRGCALALSPDGNCFVFDHRDERILRKSGDEEAQTLAATGSDGLAFSADSTNVWSILDDTLTVRAVRTGEELHEWTNFGVDGLTNLTSLAVAEGRAAIGTRNGVVKVLEAGSYRILDTAPFLGTPVRGLAVDSARRRTFIGTQDGWLRIHEEGQEFTHELEMHQDSVQSASVFPADNLIATGSADGTVHVHQVNEETVDRQFTLDFNRRKVRKVKFHATKPVLAVLIQGDRAPRFYDLGELEAALAE